MKRQCKAIVLCALALILLPILALGESIIPVEISGQAGLLRYPRLEGHADAMIQVLANQAILEKFAVLNLSERVKSPFEAIEADYEANLNGEILSAVLCVKDEDITSAKAVSIDLRTGNVIRWEQLFKDSQSAQEAMEAICRERVEPNVSSYMEEGEVLPLPLENFYLTDQEITFFYPPEQFKYFSGHAGSVSFYFYELKDYLDLSPEGIAARMGALSYLEAEPESGDLIKSAVARGKLPGIDPQLGDQLTDWLQVYRLLCEPDYYPGGRFFQTEDGKMRDIWLLSDALTESYDSNLVLGIRADRINFYGLQPGISTRDEARKLLGDGDTTVSLDASAAMDYYLPAGLSDYYTCGENMLRLHYDEEDRLVSVQLLD